MFGALRHAQACPRPGRTVLQDGAPISLGVCDKATAICQLLVRGAPPRSRITGLDDLHTRTRSGARNTGRSLTWGGGVTPWGRSVVRSLNSAAGEALTRCYYDE